jgi:hypothetical protein
MHSGILILLNAFLLFLIQPILGKVLLPKWGGTAHVWTTCLLFFQTALLAGYFYASEIYKKRTLKAQASLHAALWALSALILTALLWLPLNLSQSISSPTLAILLELSLRIGLPFVLLASTSSLVSTWHYQSTQSHHPYAWYALANLTSLAACLLYPTAIEPWISVTVQQVLWTSLYWLLTLAMIAYVLSIQRKATSLEAIESDSMAVGYTSPDHHVLVVGLSACSSIILSAATSHASQAGIIVPGLWVLPLAIYLATWWLAFSVKVFQSWFSQLGLFHAGALFGLGAVIFKLLLPWAGLVVCCGACVACIGLACHGLIYRLRPAPSLMPEFYLKIALGGALGSFFASVLAPWYFSDYYELHVGLVLGSILLSWFHARSMSEKLFYDPLTRRFAWPLTVLCPILLTGMIAMLMLTPSRETLIDQKRDFYGVVSVIENEQQSLRAMLHGRIRHGTQPIDGPLHPDQTTYYQTDSGAALAFGWCHDHFKEPLRVGILGLGTGSLSLYAHSQDSLRYFEISPAVCDLAKKHFRYLDSHSGSTEILIGDGRQLLDRESKNIHEPTYHLLVIDAFSNDSLPIHLLTVQALELYQSRLAPDGILALNITNRNLDLAPVLFATSRGANLKPLLVESKLAPYEPDSRHVRWLLLFPENTDLPAWPGSRDKLARSQDSTTTANRSRYPVWTDDFASPIHAMRW